MRTIKTEEQKLLIPISEFDVCLLDGIKKSNIIKIYPTRKDGAYYLNKFDNYLRDNHNLTIKEYVKKYIEYPKCPVSGEEVGFKLNGKGFLCSRFKKISRELCPKFDESCKRMAKERKGKGNPMYGKVPWNKGKDKRNPIIKRFAEQRRGTKASLETRRKLSEAGKRRKVHGHTGKKHSLKTRRKLAESTANLYKKGIFKRESSIHIKVREFLKTLNLKEPFEEEYVIKYFSVDFAFVKSKVCIEAQGKYFHVDPRFYPDGPVSAVQRRNFGRDKAKRKYVSGRKGWKIIEVWETEINDGSFKKYLKCELQKLNLIEV